MIFLLHTQVNTRNLSLILIILVILDQITTYYVTPSLEYEVNALHRLFKIGWAGLLINAALRVVIVIYMSYLFESTLRKNENKERQNIEEYPFHKIVLYMLGYVLIRAWIISTIIVCFNNFAGGVYLNNHFTGTFVYTASLFYLKTASAIYSEVSLLGVVFPVTLFDYIQRLLYLFFCIKFMIMYLSEHHRRFTILIIGFTITFLN